MSRWGNWSRGNKKQLGFSDFLKEGPVDQLRTGNPTGSGSVSPADRARQLGLKSNGKGGYIDPKSGQTVARTVNNELVFYSSGPTGGAISDGSGGSTLANPASSWQDPMTGLMVIPPSKAESPNELGAVPDPVPAQAPAGYNSFINKQKMQSYEQGASQPEVPEVDQAPQPEMGDMTSENYQPGQLLSRMGGDGPPPFDQMRERLKAQQGQQQAQPEPSMSRVPQEEPQPQAAPEPEPTPEENENARREQLMGALQNLMATPEKMRGAGANAMSREDAQAFMKYIQEGPQNQKVPLQDGELDYAISYLKENYKDRWNGIQNRLKGKGDPEPSRKVVSRAKEVLQSYLENLGQSSIDGSPLTFSESELDHVISLDNGGLDEGDNWAWLPRRFNQFKGALDDESLMAKLQKRLEENPADEELKEKMQALQRRQRGDWGQYFKDKGWSQLSQGDIMDQSGPGGMQFLKALAESSGTSYYKDRGVTRSSGRAGGGTSLNIDELKERLIENLGIPSQQDVDAFDENLVNILQSLEDQRSEVDSANRKRQKERRAEKKKLKEEDYLTFAKMFTIMKK